MARRLHEHHLLVLPFLVLPLLAVLLAAGAATVSANCATPPVNLVVDGNLTVNVMVDGHGGADCDRSLALGRTQIAAATWLVERLNVLQYLGELRIGLHVFDTCASPQKRVHVYLEAFLNETRCTTEHLLLPLITSEEITKQVGIISSIVTTPVLTMSETFDDALLIDMVIKFLTAMNFNSDILLISRTQESAETFLNAAKDEWMCVREYYLHASLKRATVGGPTDVIVIFGSKSELQLLLNGTSSTLKGTLILVPVDGYAEFEGTPSGSFIILPAYADYYQAKKEFITLTPTPILLQIASPILNLMYNIRETLVEDCSDATSPVACLQTHKRNLQHIATLPLEDYHILEILKIEQLYNKFVFDIYEMSDEYPIIHKYFPSEDGIVSEAFVNDYITMHKIATFNVFNRTLIYDHTKVNHQTKRFCKLSHVECLTYCVNFNRFREKPKKEVVPPETMVTIKWRREAWVAALVSISVIGFLASLAVLIFIAVRVCKGDVLEGNPTGSIFLLLTIMLMYMSVLPFSVLVEETKIEIGEPNFDYVMQREEIPPIRVVPTTNLTSMENISYTVPEVNFTNLYQDMPIDIEDDTFENTTEEWLLSNFTQTSNNTSEEEDIEGSTNEMEGVTTQVQEEMTMPTSYTLTTTGYESAVPRIEESVTTTEQHTSTPSTSAPTTQSIPVKNISIITNKPSMVVTDEKHLPTTNLMVLTASTGLFTNMVCNAAVFGVSLTYTLAFALMLSRFIMVASVGHEGGFMSHVNGYIQATLCFFITIVQLGLSLELWFIYHDCATIFSGNYFLFLVSYDGFLLVVLVFVSPFIIKSQRNYKEGTMFTIATYLICVAWMSWISIYTLVSVEWKDVVIASGVVATATILLVTVFIPRTYLMMTGIVRDNLTNALPTLAHTHSTSVLDLNFRNSSQAIYDCVNPITINSILHNSEVPTIPLRGQSNPNFYSSEPGECHATEERTPYPDDNTYERYDTPPSPSKVTRF